MPVCSDAWRCASRSTPVATRELVGWAACGALQHAEVRESRHHDGTLAGAAPLCCLLVYDQSSIALLQGGAIDS